MTSYSVKPWQHRTGIFARVLRPVPMHFYVDAMQHAIYAGDTETTNPKGNHDMKIEAGKYYKTRDGRKVGPILWQHDRWTVGDRLEGFLPMWKTDGTNDFFPEYESPEYDLIAEWTDTTDETPKLWRDMTPEEKGALLLAHHEGKEIDAWGEATSVWYVQEYPEWEFGMAYRVKPAEPVVKTVTVYGGQANGWGFYEQQKRAINTTHRITFNLIDGKPDVASIKMEAM